MLETSRHVYTYSTLNTTLKKQTGRYKSMTKADWTLQIDTKSRLCATNRCQNHTGRYKSMTKVNLTLIDAKSRLNAQMRCQAGFSNKCIPKSWFITQGYSHVVIYHTTVVLSSDLLYKYSLKWGFTMQKYNQDVICRTSVTPTVIYSTISYTIIWHTKCNQKSWIETFSHWFTGCMQFRPLIDTKSVIHRTI